MQPITIEDIDTDGYVHWRSQALGGVISAPYPQPASFYKEAEIVAADLQKIALGQGAEELRVELRDSVSKQSLPGAAVTADVAGQNVALSDAGGGVYTALLPAGLEADVDVKYSASLPGYVVSENLCALSIKPVWTADVKFCYSDVDKPPSEAPFKPGIRVTLDGPPGEYRCFLSFTTELNTVQQMLADDGLIMPTQPFEAEFSAGPRTELYLDWDRHQWEALQYCPGALRVDYTPPGNGLPLGMPTTSFTQRITPTLPMSTLLGGIDAAKLPPYIPRARRFTPTLDGELGEWPAEPSLRLTQQNGHANGAGFKDPDDGATDLWLAYDDTNLYVAGRVKDAMLKSGDMWSQDRLNLVFDALLDTTRETYPQGAVGHGGWAKDDYWVLLLPFMRGPEGMPQPATMRLGGEIANGKLGYFGLLAGARAVAVEEPGGYRFEWALPLSSLPYMTPKPRGFCGFTFFLSDHDAGLTELMYLNNWWTPSGIEWRYWDCGLLYFEP